MRRLVFVVQEQRLALPAFRAAQACNDWGGRPEGAA